MKDELRVFLFARTDNCQQHWLLAKAMRDYLGWDAKSCVKHNTYLGYPTDWILKNDTQEAAEFIKTADLIILQDAMLAPEHLDIPKYATTHNTIINGTGTAMRSVMGVLAGSQYDGWVVLPNLADETVSTHIGFTPFENWILPVEEIDALTKGIEKNDGISICHAPTAAGVKGTEKIERILQPMIDSGEITYERIQALSWEEAIQHKAKHNIILDSFGTVTKTYGAGNALEGLILRQRVISHISPWAYAIHPDLPMTTTWMKDIGEVVKEEILNIQDTINAIHHAKEEYMSLATRNERARRWAIEHFNAGKQIQHWKHFVEWVMTRDLA